MFRPEITVLGPLKPYFPGKRGLIFGKSGSIKRRQLDNNRPKRPPGYEVRGPFEKKGANPAKVSSGLSTDFCD